eukprot:5661612-Amphidinium_carterae.1
MQASTVFTESCALEPGKTICNWKQSHRMCHIKIDDQSFRSLVESWFGYVFGYQVLFEHSCNKVESRKREIAYLCERRSCVAKLRQIASLDQPVGR